MNIGVVFPQTEIGDDAASVREYTLAVEQMGFTHVLAFDHVLGADLTNRPDWRGPYNIDSTFHEPFVTFAYMAGITEKLGFVTGIIILPQRQTVLVAKQAAALDVLSNGRLRLGIGIGWNDVEYESLNEAFHNRGSRSVEQIEVMRRLWTEKSVTFDGRWHKISEAGLKPLPVQQPIPVWMGGGANERVVRRIARLADGWMPQWQPDERGQGEWETFQGYLAEYGRNPADVGLDGRLSVHAGALDTAAERTQAWRDIGAAYLSVNTMGDGLRGPEAHLRRLEEYLAAAPA